MPEVKCSVDTCEFWGPGNVCEADTIWVKNNMIGDTDDDLIYPGNVELAKELGKNETDLEKNKETSAGTSRQTCCETMRPRRSQEGSRGRRGHCGP